MKTKIYESGEDYLEAILHLDKKDGEGIKAVELAKLLNVSKPAVTKAMRILKAKGYIIQENYGNIFLTTKGREKAQEVQKIHNLVNKFLTMLGVSQQTADIDCCKIEHVISPETIEMISKFVNGENKNESH